MPMTMGQMKSIAMDMADVTGDAHVSSDRMTDQLNLRLGELQDILVGVEENYFRAEKVICLQPNVRRYPLPANLYRIMKLWQLGTGGQMTPLRRGNLSQVSNGPTPSNPWADRGDSAGSYAIVGTDLELLNCSTASNLLLWYVPQYARLANDSDTISASIPNGFEEFAIIGLAIYLRRKEESDTSTLDIAKAECKQRIIDNASQRDEGEADQVEDWYATHGAGRRRTVIWGR